MFINIFAFLTSGGYFVIDMKVTYIFIKYPKIAFRENFLKIGWIFIFINSPS